MLTQTNISNDPVTADDLISMHAGASDTRNVLAYPRVDGDLSSYEYYNLARVDEIVNMAASCLAQNGASRQCKPYTTVAGIIGPSSLDLLISACALSRLGYTVLILSPRLSSTATAALIREVQCQLVFIGDQFWKSTVPSLTVTCKTCKFLRLPSRGQWQPLSQTCILARPNNLSTQQTSSKTAFILHSSGSTGLPKPIFTSHRRYIENAKTSFEHAAFVTLPLYHAYGFSSFFRAVAGKTLLVLPDSTLPLTAETVAETLERTRPQMLSVVPYTLKLLSEMPESWPILKDLKLVTFHGSACSEEVGNLLVNKGVNLVAHMGSSEAGALATSARPPGDHTWNYLRFLPYVKPYVHMKHVSGDIFELVLLDGLKTKVLSNSDDPPNSLHTRDLFRQHRNISDAWLYLGRQDDRVTLANGEKVLPLPIEACIGESPLIRQALVFGIGKDYPGVLIFRSEQAASMSDEALMHAVWPWVERANHQAEGFSQISQAMTILVPANTSYPQTDKGSVIRTRTYQAFAQEIELAYDRMLTIDGPKLKYGLSEMREHLLRVCQEELVMPTIDPASDLFRSGLDSLKASQLVSYIRRRIELDKHAQAIGIPQIYQAGNLELLAQYLCGSTDVPLTSTQTLRDQANNLIDRYGIFPRNARVSGRSCSKDKVLLLTGATGSLGSHVLAKALSQASYAHVFCLVRPKEAQSPQARVLAQLHKQRLFDQIPDNRAFTVLAADLAQPDLGLARETYEALTQNVTHIVHAAWTVNFTQPLSAFESTDIIGTHNLLSFALTTAHHSSFQLCSSISVAARSPSSSLITEELITDFSYASETGYGHSKLVAEHLVARARAAGVDASSLRIGQLIGSRSAAIWNDTEIVPLMVRSALITPDHTIPALTTEVSWLPVDVCAATILDLSTVSGLRDVFNLSNPSRMSWTKSFLPALRDAGVPCKAVPPCDWVACLRTYAEQHGSVAAERNPAVKLLDFWERRYSPTANVDGDIVFDTTEAERHSDILSDFGREDDLLIRQGYVTRFVEEWRKTWKL